MDGSSIFALASGAGRAGIAVVRLSGPAAGRAVTQLTLRALPAARRAVRANLFAADGGLVDHAIVIWFPGPASFTGEDVAEFHVHGGRAVLNALFAALVELPGVRPAEPGEFTRRAFENDKLDLTVAEGLADLVAAETEGQRRQALRQMGGSLAELYGGWRSALIRLLAEVEVAIDFPDEDLPEGLLERAALGIGELASTLARHLDDKRIGERVRDGLSIVILGRPNVGKSSLLNYLAGRDAAIVSTEAGTTRDIIEVRLDLGGLPVTVSDTAGLRPTENAIEAEGIRRAVLEAGRADLRLLMVEAADWPEIPAELAAWLGPDAMVVVNKTDLRPVEPEPEKSMFPISLSTGRGLENFYAALQQIITARFGVGQAAGITRIRHRQALESCLAALSRAGRAPSPELMAEDLRLAARCLGSITGRVDVEDVLDVLFSEFCIGK